MIKKLMMVNVKAVTRSVSCYTFANETFLFLYVQSLFFYTLFIVVQPLDVRNLLIIIP
jgi:hypothetical protein